MTNYQTEEEEVEVLFAFQMACEVPTAEDIIEWTKRYPDSADAIREHAEALLAAHRRERLQSAPVNESMLVKGRSAAMSAIYDAENADQPSSDKVANLQLVSDSQGSASDLPAGDFDQLLESVEQTIAQLARDMSIDRFVIATLAAGRMALPVGDRFLQALVSILACASATIISAIDGSLRKPRLGHAKARDRPSFEVRSFEDVIADSDKMSQAQKDYWLDKTSEWTPGTKFE